MSIWYAIFWGGLSSAALFLGQALAPALEPHAKATGLLMGFGAGTMLSAVAYELIPSSDSAKAGASPSGCCSAPSCTTSATASSTTGR